MGVESTLPPIMFHALVVGPESSGKTTFVKSLQRTHRDNFLSMPTIGFAREYVDLDNVRYCLLDHGGQDCLKRYWKRLFGHVSVIIYVFDDDHNVAEAVRTLMEVVVFNKEKPLLVVANDKESGANRLGRREWLENELKRATKSVDVCHLALCNVSDVAATTKQFKIFVKAIDKSLRKRKK